eukprot:11539649-Heterocapsa_arctica.AAC.1
MAAILYNVTSSSHGWFKHRQAVGRRIPGVAMDEASRALAMPVSLARRGLQPQRLHAGLHDVCGGCGNQPWRGQVVQHVGHIQD